MAEDDDIGPVSPELRSFLDAERAAPPPSEIERARAWSRLAAATTPPAVRWSTRLAWGAGGVVIGALLGALGYAMLAPRHIEERVRVETREVRVEVPVEVPVEPIVPAPIEDAGTPIAIETAPRGERLATRDRDAGTASRDRLLAQENALITRAQSALARRQASLALDALRAHAAQFPSGQFVEEREVMWVQALVLAGDREAAIARAERFRHRFGGSLLLPAIEAAIAEGAR